MNFAAFSNILLKTFVPNLVSITFPSIQRLRKLRRGLLWFSDFYSISYKKICCNSRTSDEIEMELRPVTKRDKRNKTRSKRFDDDFMSKKVQPNCHFSDFWPMWSSLEARFWTQSLRKLFSVTVTFFFTKNENRTKNSLTQLSYYYIE